jgi:putative transcriptional regulator
MKRTVDIRPPKPLSPRQIVAIRQRLDYSQSMFARLLNVSPRTIQDWEQGRRIPSDSALRLLAVAAKHPEVLLDV